MKFLLGYYNVNTRTLERVNMMRVPADRPYSWRHVTSSSDSVWWVGLIDRFSTAAS